jgi:aldehyde dehydrogenase (NAD+)
MKTYRYFADNAWHEPASGNWFDSENPAAGEVWARLPDCNAEDVARAVAAARSAFYDGPWGRMLPAERGRVLRRIGDVIAANAERLGEIETATTASCRRTSRPRCGPGPGRSTAFTTTPACATSSRDA